VAVAEPLSRPECIHEYQITLFSLYSAITSGSQLSPDDIIVTLNSLSKNALADELKEWIFYYGHRLGKLRYSVRG